MAILVERLSRLVVEQIRSAPLGDRRRIRHVPVPFGQYLDHILQPHRRQFHRALISALVGEPLGILQGSHLDRTDSRTDGDESGVHHVVLGETFGGVIIAEISPKDFPEGAGSADSRAHGEIIQPRLSDRSELGSRSAVVVVRRRAARQRIQCEFQRVVRYEVGNIESGTGVQTERPVEGSVRIDSQCVRIEARERAEFSGRRRISNADDAETYVRVGQRVRRRD
mmetsp:Transcript_5944/g.17146  ORF Transcript_5944/g.17146 Transcript_5944/m.17146 type:complete len:225 (+) Transcript_5944:871-1545(+)